MEVSRVYRIAASCLLLATLGVLDACRNVWGISAREFDATLSCSEEGCQCAAGFADCNQDEADGCESNLNDISSCGGCKRNCINGTCQQQACVCNPGSADCNGDKGDGCETSLNDTNACGGCRNHCDNGNCVQGQCQCASEYSDCNHNLEDGCEVHVFNEPHHCGACGNDCLGGACKGGICQPMPFVTFPSIVNQNLFMNISKENVYVGNCYNPSNINSSVGATVRILRISKSTGSIKTISYDGDGCLLHLVRTDGANVYWLRVGGGLTKNTIELHAAPLAGGNARRVIELSSYGDYANYSSFHDSSPFAVGGGYAYWFAYDGKNRQSVLIQVNVTTGEKKDTKWKIPPDTCSKTPLFADAKFLYTATKQGIFALSHQSLVDRMVIEFPSMKNPIDVSAITTSASSIVWSGPNGEGLYRAPLVGGTPKLITKSKAYNGFIVDEQAVYWFSDSSHVLHKTSLDGKEAILQEGFPLFSGEILADDVFLYSFALSPELSPDKLNRSMLLRTKK